MKVKHFVLAGAIGMLTIVGMPQTEASPLSDVLDTQANCITVSDSSQDMVGLRGGHGGYDPGRHGGWEPGHDPRHDRGWDRGHDPRHDRGWDRGHDPRHDRGWGRGHDPRRDRHNPPPHH